MIRNLKLTMNLVVLNIKSQVDLVVINSINYRLFAYDAPPVTLPCGFPGNSVRLLALTFVLTDCELHSLIQQNAPLPCTHQERVSLQSTTGDADI